MDEIQIPELVRFIEGFLNIIGTLHIWLGIIPLMINKKYKLKPIYVTVSRKFFTISKPIYVMSRVLDCSIFIANNRYAVAVAVVIEMVIIISEWKNIDDDDFWKKLKDKAVGKVQAMGHKLVVVYDPA